MWLVRRLFRDRHDLPAVSSEYRAVPLFFRAGVLVDIPRSSPVPTALAVASGWGAPGGRDCGNCRTGIPESSWTGHRFDQRHVLSRAARLYRREFPALVLVQ